MEQFATLKQLITEHEAEVRSLALKRTRLFTTRAKWLISEIRKEIPAIKRVVISDGSILIEPAKDPILYLNRKTGDRFIGPLNSITAFYDGPIMKDELPVVSETNLQHLIELNKIAEYIGAAAKLATLKEIDIFIFPGGVMK